MIEFNELKQGKQIFNLLVTINNFFYKNFSKQKEKKKDNKTIKPIKWFMKNIH